MYQGLAEFFRVVSVLLDQGSGVIGGGLKFSVSIGIEPDGIGGAYDSRDEGFASGLVGARDFPIGSGDAGAGGDDDEMGVVGGLGNFPSDACFFAGAMVVVDGLFAEEDAIGIKRDVIGGDP